MANHDELPNDIILMITSLVLPEDPGWCRGLASISRNARVVVSAHLCENRALFQRYSRMTNVDDVYQKSHVYPILDEEVVHDPHIGHYVRI